MTELWPFRKGQYPDRVTGRILARRLFGRDNFAFIDPLRYDARCASLDEAFRQLVTEGFLLVASGGVLAWVSRRG